MWHLPAWPRAADPEGPGLAPVALPAAQSVLKGPLPWDLHLNTRSNWHGFCHPGTKSRKDANLPHAGTLPPSRGFSLQKTKHTALQNKRNAKHQPRSRVRDKCVAENTLKERSVSATTELATRHPWQAATLPTVLKLFLGTHSWQESSKGAYRPVFFFFLISNWKAQLQQPSVYLKFI